MVAPSVEVFAFSVGVRAHHDSAGKDNRDDGESTGDDRD
jgi:hypothetical protein